MGELILGIETSCDETAAALVRGGTEVLSSAVQSQVDVHRRFGGVVPEIASRHHIANIVPVVLQAVDAAGASLRDIEVVAVTNRPGLVGALLVGVSLAKGLAYALRRPLVAVNHLHAHVYANFLAHPHIELPAVCLVVSGGHTSLAYMPAHGVFEVMGETRDDAAGEAFDKVARFLGLGYPGGPAIEEAARGGAPGRYRLPRVLLDPQEYEFSFSGLKTATVNLWRRLQSEGTASVNDLAAEFQAALVDVLVEKTVHAARHTGVRTVLLAGGVAANSRLREALAERAAASGLQLFYPPLSLCTDNAAMVAACAHHLYLRGETAGLDVNAHPAVKTL
ncbi:MAG: tRNA (adenosine(37)-N6)-threonylcarbamoyltransferase complex transferase subunit TsaD [Syntrophomonadaceae bacterium]|jgi:N6-L-threonylcarbamoyladenine synthase|nr:tRNA (adenosine(37)-N6)-threonylcarbamoyltransferase complex transferase subunit TsaD [Syntrophomonadaceae bacterium]